MPAPPPAGPDQQPSTVSALRYGGALLVAGVAGEMALRFALGRMPAGEQDLAGMVGFWFIAAVLVVAMRLRPKRPR
ncbi:MAG: hypothetical protein ACKOWF_04995 [Chloroflexota bacterium]